MKALSLSQSLLLATVVAIPSLGGSMKKAAAVVAAALSQVGSDQGELYPAIRNMPHVKVRLGSARYQGDIDISEWMGAFETVKALGLVERNGPFHLTADGARVGQAILSRQLENVEVKLEPAALDVVKAPFFDSFIARVKELWQDNPKHVYRLAAMA